MVNSLIANFGTRQGANVENAFNRAIAAKQGQRQNALAQHQEDIAQQQDLSQQEQEFIKSRVAAMATHPEEVRAQMWPAVLQEYESRFPNSAGKAPRQYSPEMFNALMGRTGVAMPQPVTEPAMPSNVREWQFFNALSKPDQERFLTMKRSNQILNLGGRQAILNPTGGVQEEYEVTPKITETPTYKAKVAKRVADAKAQSKVESDAPAKLQQAEDMLNTINEIIKHPGRAAATGRSSVFNVAAPLIGGDRVDFLTLLDQLKGQSFLQAFNSLKGGGQITETEGRKAEQAIARLNTAQSEEGFLKALEDLRTVVISSINRSKVQMKRKKKEDNQDNDPLGLGI